jgi:hypothetical protein
METRVSTGYDFVQNGVTYTQLRFEEIYLAGEWTSTGHLFEQMPTGILYWNKIRVLSDIKWDKRSTNTSR